MTETVITSAPAETGIAPSGGEQQQAAAPAAAQDWAAGFDDNTRGLIQTKGWKTPADVLGSYQNLEKLMGADKAGRGVVIPKADATPEEWGAFYSRLGRPEKPEAYKLAIPEGSSPEFAAAAASKFHELGLTEKQAESLGNWWNEQAGGIMEGQTAAFEQQAAIDMQDLRKEWGQQFEANAEMARRARRESGLTDQEGQAIERALGLKKAAQVFAHLGKQFAEAPMKGGEGSAQGRFGSTPEDARARIAALKGDQEWTARYLKGDTSAAEEFKRLHQIAFSDAQ